MNLKQIFWLKFVIVFWSDAIQGNQKKPQARKKAVKVLVKCTNQAALCFAFFMILKYVFFERKYFCIKQHMSSLVKL